MLVAVFASELVVMEASGGYKLLCAATLAQGGLPVTVVNDRQVRAYAMATGVLTRTDAVDARVLTHFAAAVRPLPDAQRQALDEILGCRLPLVGMLLMEKNHLAQAQTRGAPRYQEPDAILEKRIGGCDTLREPCRAEGREGVVASEPDDLRHA